MQGFLNMPAPDTNYWLLQMSTSTLALSLTENHLDGVVLHLLYEIRLLLYFNFKTLDITGSTH